MVRLKTAILIIGDVLLLYLGLAITLALRYDLAYFKESFRIHLKPFSAIFVVWILIFYLADLYEVRTFKKGFQFARNFIAVITLNVGISIILFYLFNEFFKLTPKTNLAIFAAVFGLLDLGFRFLILKSSYAKTRLLIIGDSPAVEEVASYVRLNPQLGYELIFWLKSDIEQNQFQKLEQLVIDKKMDFIIVPIHFIKKDLPMVKFLYKLLPHQIKVISMVDFYEVIFQKAPLEELEEGWFIEKITTRRKTYELVKRILDLVLGIILTIIFSPIMLINVILVKLSSPGPSICSQMRTGKNGMIFYHYKFRIMRSCNERGPLWTEKGDKRLTPVGKFLRYTHLDEIPQLWNIIKGNISFIGPRPERIELAEKYKELPYYEMRHIIKPGLTGWAQLNYRPSASLEEAFEKLKYDIYYIKNRSLILDLLIILKTVRAFFSKPQ